MAPGMIQINSNSNGPNSENGKFTAMSNVVEPISLSNDHSTDKTITNGISNNDNCYPIAVLMCRKNSSHPFDERRLPLNSPAKVGRAVARAKPSEENAIFDCKVLSRNHALVWFEDGKFYLQDTKSSNGTFINNKRLSPANEESQPSELCSGDIVQFGVDVLENTKKVTHGCIIATVKLLLPDGSEAKSSKDRFSDSELMMIGSSQLGHQNVQTSLSYITTTELYQLSQYLSEAFYREKLLEGKLSTLQNVIHDAHQAAENGWKSLVEEDRLLSRIETLQNKLEIYLNNKSINDDSRENAISNLRDEIVKLQEEREKYESAAKEALQKALEEKLSALEKFHQYEELFNHSQEETNRYKQLYDDNQTEIVNLTNKIDELIKEINELNDKYKKSEAKQLELIEASKEEKKILEEQLMSQLKDKEAEVNRLIHEMKPKRDTNDIETHDEVKLQITMKHENNFQINEEFESNQSKTEMNNLVNKINELTKENAELNLKLKEFEMKYNKMLELSKEEKRILQEHVNELKMKNNELNELVVQLKQLNSSSQLKIEKQMEEIVIMKQEKVTEINEKLVTNKNEAENAQRELTTIQEQMVRMKEKLEEVERLNDTLSSELTASKEDYEIVSYQSKIASACAIVPLIMLFIAIIIAYYPSVSSVTGTSES